MQVLISESIWAFIQPIVTICVYWFVFGLALRNGSDKGVPFVLWLIAGLIPWFFLQEGLLGGTNALLEYNYLVKKVVFNIRILPVVKVLLSSICPLFLCGDPASDLYLYGISTQPLCTAADLLQYLHLCTDPCSYLYDKCGSCVFQRFKSDHQYHASGRSVGDTDHVGF